MQDHWLVREGTIKRLWAVFAVVLAVAAFTDLTVEHHPHFGLDGIFGFGAWFGFISCVALIVFAKALGAVLNWPDDHYER